MNKIARMPLIAGNWKMNGQAAMAEALVDAIAAGMRGDDVGVLVIPPFPYLARLRDRVASAGMSLGAQDLSAHESGAYTGEVSGAMLADVGAGYVLVGHSERRRMHHETDAVVAAKFEAALAAGLKPVLCVGETREQREADETETVVAAQVDAVIARCGAAALAGAVIAYEPVWAIGTGLVATPDEAQQVHAFIRARLAGHDATIAGRIQILYGGSMKPQNAAELLACEDIDGGLIGGASLKADDFLAIVAAGIAMAG
ncbi:MAG: triose-phosphate isomerase [Wenzhouxiangellaceae bacterium]